MRQEDSQADFPAVMAGLVPAIPAVMLELRSQGKVT